MIRQKYYNFLESLGLKTRQEKLFVLFAMLCGFCISADYAIVRPVSNSVFLSFYDSSILPYVWLSAIPLNLAMVSLYNRYLPVLGCWRMLLAIASVILLGNLAAFFFISSVPGFPFIHFMWKEVYVLLLFQALWSVIHTTMNMKQAKAFYGTMFGVGGLGSVVGSMVPGFFAVKLGSEGLLVFSVPICLLLMLFYRFSLRYSESIAGQDHLQRGRPAASLAIGIQLIRNSKFLPLILLLVVLMQVAATLLDYQFNIFLQSAYPIKNIRTEFMGKLGGIVSTSTIFIQFIGTYFLLRWIGLRGSHFFVPLTLASNALAAFFFPGVGTLAFSFASVKVLDFSLFSVIKEMLYINLPVEEKFQAKAVIDVFAYRSAKALASVIILGFQMLQFTNLRFLSLAGLGIFAIWIITIFALFRRYREPIRA